MTAIRGVVQTFGELMQFMWRRKLWWLLPMIIILVLFSVLVILGSSTTVGPFIYTLF